MKFWSNEFLDSLPRIAKRANSKLNAAPPQGHSVYVMNNHLQARREDLDFRILRLLQGQPMLTQRELADKVGVSVGQINYCLRALVDKGCVKIGNFRRSGNKLAYAYLLTPSGVAEKAEIAVRFLQRKVAEYEQIKSEIAALQSELQSGEGIRERHSG